MKAPNNNVFNKRTNTRKRVRKHRMMRQVQEERQNLIRNSIQQNVNNFPDDQTISNCLSQEKEKKSFDQELRGWSKKHNISAGAINALLKILICYGFTWLPSDYRSFLQTPRNVDISMKAYGKMWYNGTITKTLQQIFSTLTRDISISLVFNVDGLPLFNSSKAQFWPILTSIHGKRN